MTTIGIFCSDDWANYGYELAASLMTTNKNIIAAKLNSHVFNYQHQLPIVSADELVLLAKKCDIILLVHSAAELIQYIPNETPIIPIHTGTRYRNEHIQLNNLFHLSRCCFTDQCEFMSLAENIHYIGTPINIDMIPKFGHEPRQPYIIGHYPSNADVKGTQKILDMLQDINPNKYILHHSTDRVSHAEQLQRINKCDIYIELFQPTLNGKPYGCFGVTAFEAAAAGKIVITQNINPKAYTDVFGTSPFILTESESDFKFKVNYCLSMPQKELTFRQTNNYNAMKERHSYKATGERIIELINDYYA